MEVPSLLFFPVCSSIAVIFLKAGIDDLFFNPRSSENIRDSWRASLFVYHSLTFSVFYSITHAFLLRPFLQSNPNHQPSSVEMSAYLFGSSVILYISFRGWSWLLWLIAFCGAISLIHPPPPKYSSRVFVLFHYFFWGFLVLILFAVCSSFPFPTLPFVNFTYTVYVLLFIGFRKLSTRFRVSRWLRESAISMNLRRKRDLVEFIVGVVGGLAFQILFQSEEVKVTASSWLCLVVVWLGNLGLVQPRTDLGIFNFLLTNVVVSQAVDLYKLRKEAWLFLMVAFTLGMLRHALNSVSPVYDAFLFLPCRRRRRRPTSPQPASAPTATTPLQISIHGSSPQIAVPSPCTAF